MRQGRQSSGVGSWPLAVRWILQLSLMFLMVVVTTCFAPFPTMSFAATEYEIYQLTDNPYEEEPVVSMMSPSGSAFFWRQWDGSDYEIFLFDGSTFMQITDNDDDDFAVDINDEGHVVWEGTDGTGREVFLYDGNETRQITHDDLFDLGYFLPQINNAGHVLWDAWNGTTTELLLYNGTDVIQVAEDIHTFSAPHMNDHGHVVWSGLAGILLYDGTRVSQISDPDNAGGWLPRISNNGYVTWEAITVIDIGVTYAHDVILYDGEDAVRVTEHTGYIGGYGPQMWPRIDRRGNVFWSEPAYGIPSSRILTYDGDQITELAVRTGDCRLDMDYDFNNRGQFVFVESCGENPGENSSIFFSDGITETKIADDSQLSSRICCAQISDTGLIVWGGRDIHIAVPKEVGLLSPEDGAALSSAPTFEWSPGIYDAFGFYAVFHYPALGYVPIGFWILDNQFSIPSSWWEQIGTEWPCFWTVLGLNTTTGEWDMADPRWFQRIESLP